jgi:hypothetical protein
MISSYILPRSHNLVGKNTPFIIVTGPDANNSSCFQGGSKILSPLLSCLLSLYLSYRKPILLVDCRVIFRAQFGAHLHDIAHVD